MSEWWTPGEEASGRTVGYPPPAVPPVEATPAPMAPAPAPAPAADPGKRSNLARRGAVAAVACLAVAGASLAIADNGAGGPAAATSLSAKAATSTTQPSGKPPAPPAFPGGPGRRGQRFFAFGGFGTISSITSGGFTVKRADGSSATFTTSSSTTYREGTVTVGRSALAVGEQVLVGTAKPTSPTSSSSTQAATMVQLVLPEVAGKVVSVSGSTVVVQDSQGFWRTVDLSGSTVYQSAGKASSASAVKVGVYVAVGGTIASDHTTLDASAVEVLGTKPAGGRGSRPGGAFGFGAPGLLYGGPNGNFAGGPPAFPGGPAQFGGQPQQSSGSNTPA